MATALITGASSGLGAEFAKLFVADKHDVVLVARRRDRLEALAAELRTSGVRADVIAADLAATSGAQAVIEEVGRLGAEIEFLVNNAGAGATGAFAEMDLSRSLSMVQLNIASLLALTRAFLPPMLARRRGRVLNVGSTAGCAPGPFMAVYYASKAFVNSFSEALAYELRGSGVTATASLPGATETEFATVAGNRHSLLFRLGAASARSVARQAYRAMMSGRPVVVHGIKNKLTVQSLRVSPRSLTRAITASLNATRA